MEKRSLLKHRQDIVIIDRFGSWHKIAVNRSGSEDNDINDGPNPNNTTELAPTSTVVLPDDAIVDILSRVPARSIHRFKCVSRAWRDLIANPLHRKRLPQTLEGFFCNGFEFHDDSSSDAPSDSSLHVCMNFIGLPGRSMPLGYPSLSYLTKHPSVHNDTRLLGCCNGLLLFANDFEKSKVRPTYGMLGYIVCNPATKQWVTVPSPNCPPPSPQTEAPTYLIFDPAMSPHFHLVHIWQNGFMGEIELRTYSSETRVWKHRSSDRRQWQEGSGWEPWVNDGAIITSMVGSAFVKGMQRFIVFDSHKKEYLIAGVNVEGKTCRNICWPEKSGGYALLIGQSQGLMHCVSEHVGQEDNCLQWAGLSIWVLKDYNTEEWVLKDKVSFLKLFGGTSGQVGSDYNVIAIHPDRNMIFLLQHRNKKLISYDMDNKELHASDIPRSSFGIFTPYVPCFLESSVLENKD